MMLKDGAQQAVVAVEIVDVLLPKVGGREHETIVLGEEDILVLALDVVDVQAQIAQRDVRFVVVDDLEQLEHFEERSAKCVR
jgi:hypothetical protein